MDLTDLKHYAKTNNQNRLISQIEDFLNKEDVKGTKGAQRILVVCANFKFLSFEEAYRVIDPDTFQDEYEETQLHKRHVKLLNYMRIALSLAPLILTWLALFWATSNYQTDLQNHPEDQTVAFLQLWQAGFHNTTPFTFSVMAFTDVILLGLLLISTILALSLEHNARQASKQFAKDLREVIEGLLKVVNTEGNNALRSDADIDKIVKALRVALRGVFDTTEDAIKQALDVVLKANNRVDQLFTNHVQPLFTKFEQNVNTFHRDVNKLTQEVSAISTATTNMAQASTEMANSASAMTASATTLQDSVKEIDTHLVTLNQTEGEMVTKIEAAQQNVANEVKNAATDMNAAAGKVTGVASDINEAAQKLDQAAQKVENVGQTLTTINPQNVRQMSNDVTALTTKAKETAQELQKTIDAINKLSRQSGPKRTRILGIIPSPFQRP